MKVLFLTLYPEIMPSSRYRVYQCLPYLESAGIDFEALPAVPLSLFKHIYNSGNCFGNAAYVITEAINRTYQLLKASSYDAIFIQKGLTAINLRGLPSLLKDKRVIFDVDDNVFGHPVSSFSSSILSVFQDKEQAAYLAGMSKVVIAGNSFLVSLASKYNKDVRLIPTSVNTDKFVPAVNNLSGSRNLTIGWIGGPSTSGYLKPLANVLKTITQKYPVTLEIIGDARFSLNGINLNAQPWRYETEISRLQEFDIGIMPMPDNEWTRGKCGLKALQYMSVGIPAVCSAVGANLGIIKDGLNGFLAATEEEWLDKLSLLLENPDLRRRLGQAGRQEVEERYSLKANAPRLKRVIEEVAS